MPQKPDSEKIKMVNTNIQPFDGINGWFSMTGQHRMQKIRDSVQLEGLTRLITRGERDSFLEISSGISKEELKRKSEDWEKNQKGPNPLDIYKSFIWVPRELETTDKKIPKIIQVYNPINFSLPFKEDEEYSKIKGRIEKESIKPVNYMKEKFGYPINAFHISNIEMTYVPSLLTLGGALASDEKLKTPAKDCLVLRVNYDLSLFEIEEEK